MGDGNKGLIQVKENHRHGLLLSLSFFKQLVSTEDHVCGSTATTRLLKEVGIRGQAQRKAVKELAAAAERSSHWLWLKRRDAT